MKATMTEAIETLVAERAKAMKNGDARKANEIADELTRFGVVLADEQYGTRWHVGG